MKIIISHDVDHLYRKDHYKDLIYPKLFVRSTIQLFKRKCTLKEWIYRVYSIFLEERHFINEVISFDKENGVPSTFFFGMAKGLGMSYGSKAAQKCVEMVSSKGFDVGVHGISYCDFNKMKYEYDEFLNIFKQKCFGIRMHYVRFNETTFKLLNECGYLYDTTEFNKEDGYLIKNPYKVGDMWEFPLAIMDSYLPDTLEEKKKKTLEIISKAKEENLPYLTILFHGDSFSNGYVTEKEWYKWIIKKLSEDNYEFISYIDAINELEAGEITEYGEN